MTEVLAFMAANGCLTSFLACMALSALVTAAKAALIGLNRMLRMLNIRAHGWPPEHLDADGDFRAIEAEVPKSIAASILDAARETP